MIKTILVPVGASGVDGPAFGVAAHLAKLFTAHIDFLFARPEPITAAAVYGAVIPGTLEQLRAAAERQHQQMKDAYLSACERARIPTDIVGPAAGKVTARWHRETGPVASWVASYGRTSDLLIVPRPGSDDFPGAQGLEGALLESGRPVLIPSSSRMPPVETIAIAWKSSRESARAVTAAYPFLSCARRILIINSGAGSASDRDDMERLATGLRRHHSEVEAEIFESDSPDIGKALLWKASLLGADLLVMGAYSRTRARELVFGGVTRRVLEGAEIPVIMAH